MLKTIQINDRNSLSYNDAGDKTGHPILIQHGLIASIRDVDLFKRLVERGARLISIARPGYGESSPLIMDSLGEWADLVSVVVDQLELSRFDVLGISSGAPYSYSLGYKLPDRVRSLFILSGTPALYDDKVLSFWPYPVSKNASIDELQQLARELFFSNLSATDQQTNAIKDSMMNDCFGIAQDLKIRCIDWGFRLSGVRVPVYMQHSRFDGSVPLITAELTADLLPNCTFKIKETDQHFSQELLDDFIDSIPGI